MEPDPYRSPESGFNTDQPENAMTRRIGLLPMWVMLFNWIYLFLGILSVIVFAAIMIAPLFDVMLTVSPLSPFGLQWDGMMLFILPPVLAIGAYGLLYGKPWGSKFALAGAYLGLVLSLWPYVQTFAPESWRTSWNLFITGFYLYTLHRIHRQWRGAGSEKGKASEIYN